MSYIAGGMVPLAPYFVFGSVHAALIGSVGVTLLALLVFGYVKGRFTTAKPFRSACQTVVVGGLAAAAFLIEGGWVVARGPKRWTARQRGGDVNDTQLAAIETALGLTLPPAYRQVSRAFPFRPIGPDRVYWSFDDPSRVIHGTRFPLEHGGYAGPALPPRYVGIGESGGGDLYLLDTTASNLAVALLRHEAQAVEAAWPTFEAFVEEWVRAPDEIAKARAVEQAAARARQCRLWLLVGVPLVITLLLALLAMGLAAGR